ncbi:NADPH dehydrogenase NamA [Ferruginibacter lapsinanis]|uniref:NADPH dehydrogenase NamA n=1 Tax=Ferruginibacter lapsinanis TaxID=563172 RepID=UPI001E2A8748|nr:NADPH dehydrogenase NamA [Ferruginibacter lapsinanis]UEG50054.1 NADPH dehydrogenase NamA [Ferruginibacter lapsinanis]
MSLLFTPLKIKSVEFKNRIVVSPMCQYSSVDGFASDWHLVHLGSRAVGGAALIMQEATAVSPEGRISYGDMGIWKDEHIEKLHQITSFIHEHGAVAGIQLAHAGRKASTEKPWEGDKQILSGENHWQTVSASPIPFREGEMIPHELTATEIASVINDFKNAAVRSLKAGFKLVEIHAAHGYLINQFLSPLCNQRTDGYGGSFDNRIKFLLEIIDAVKTVWPAELPIFVRISATDWVEGGWTIDDSVQLALVLKEKGIDLIDTSSGGTSPLAKIPVGPGYQVQLAAAIKKQTGILTGAVGIITNAQQAEEILQQEQADFIFMAREHLRDPYFALHAALELDENIEWPVQYARAKRNKK